MASYAAVRSAMHTIEHLSTPTPQLIIKSAYDHLLSLKEILSLSDADFQVTIEKAYSIATTNNALEAFESHLSNHFPSEYQIIQFSQYRLTPLHSFLENSLVLGDQDIRLMIGEAVIRLEDVVETLVSIFRISLAFLLDMEEEINKFKESVMNLKAYNQQEDPLLLNDGLVSFEFLNLIDLLTGFCKFANDILAKAFQKSDMSKSSERLNALDGQIREAAYKLEDAIEAHLSNNLLLQPDDIDVDLHEVKQDIDSFTNLVKGLKEKYVNELFNLSPENSETDAFVSSRIDFSENKSKMVGFSDELSHIRDQIKSQSSELKTIALTGMGGIGKTTFAKEVYGDPSTLELFDLCVWVDVGPTYQVKETMQAILAQVEPDDIASYKLMGEEELGECLCESLSGRKFFIVLDDVWESTICYYLKMKLGNDHDGSRILLTTRLGRIKFMSWISVYEMRFLNTDESWELLREKVFGEEKHSCPHELEKAGKKIAENCEGLPLTIVTIADILSKADKTVEYWNEVAEKKNSVFMDAYDRISNVLLRSYRYLPQRSKICFLYMGVFPQSYEIPSAVLFDLWAAEGCFDVFKGASNIDLYIILDDLVSSNLLISSRKHSTHSNRVKRCTLHSTFWHLCKGEAGKNKFFHVVNSRTDGLAEGIKSQRRLCVHNNMLFGIKEVYKSIASISNARSLLCTGPYHRYPVPICFGLRLLRVLKALNIRFYEFPIEALELVCLRYLAFTYDEKLPASISKLRRLQFLIVRPHFTIKSSRAPSRYLPVEIWGMKELLHLQVMGSELPNPCGATLPSLMALLDVGPCSCTKEVLEGLPNLIKLGIRIELAPDHGDQPLCFDHISNLSVLESLTCVVVNPRLCYDAPLAPLSNLSMRLKKVSLSGLESPWEYTSTLKSLPSLEELKLRCYAFRGHKWEIKTDDGFPELKFLAIEDADLVHWEVERGSFRSLRILSLKHCYGLEVIPRELLGDSLSVIEVIDCNHLAGACAKQMQKERDGLTVNVHSS